MEWGRLGVNGTGRASLLVGFEFEVAIVGLAYAVSGVAQALQDIREPSRFQPWK